MKRYNKYLIFIIVFVILIILFNNKDYFKKKSYRDIINEVIYFPIPKEYSTGDSINFEDSFMEPRTYGGDRYHYGIDIMSNENTSGIIPIVSMTYGVLENIGWNELGGWRVGIRSKKGNYYYYAHLDRYVDGLEKGMYIEAGDLLGYMGNSGYGEVATIGKFPVHLHIGIMDRYDEWINPYNILKRQ